MTRIEGLASAHSLAFGECLLAQKDRDGLIGMLAAGAAADRAFPRDGYAEELRARLRVLREVGDMVEVVDDAELDWAAD